MLERNSPSSNTLTAHVKHLRRRCRQNLTLNSKSLGRATRPGDFISSHFFFVLFGELAAAPPPESWWSIFRLPPDLLGDALAPAAFFGDPPPDFVLVAGFDGPATCLASFAAGAATDFVFALTAEAAGAAVWERAGPLFGAGDLEAALAVGRAAFAAAAAGPTAFFADGSAAALVALFGDGFAFAFAAAKALAFANGEPMSRTFGLGFAGLIFAGACGDAEAVTDVVEDADADTAAYVSAPSGVAVAGGDLPREIAGVNVRAWAEPPFPAGGRPFVMLCFCWRAAFDA